MKILLVNYEYTLTGSTLLLLNLAEHLRRSGHDVSVCAAQPAPGPIKEEYLRRGFAVLDPSDAGRADLAICNTVLTAPQLLALAGAMKTIWWIHEGTVGLDHLLRHPSHVEAFARASVIVFPIPHLRDAIYRSFTFAHEDSRLAVIPYGIPPIALPLPQPAEETAFRIVSIGSVYPRKRHYDLIRAMMLYQDPRAHCTIIGKFYRLPDDCLKFIEANPDRIELVGELGRDATLARLNTADLFCLPSDSEVMPVTILEAAMLEKPLLLSDLSVYEGLWRHGRNCMLYPVGAIGMLAQAMAQLGANPELRRRLGAASRQTAAPFTEAAFNARFDAVLSTQSW
ncbi:MAG TPA: glycosyltransferase family 4 protein [Stellaceae bacterium]|jgi:glycosyltransferase involved in cell wall biosynthesis|nr:glycosyltransferase family 4 protein [Stellaceae bacterium]